MDYAFNDPGLLRLDDEITGEIAGQFAAIDTISQYNQYKVLRAFRENKVSEHHFAPTTGYGYGDTGRDTLDRVFARVFGAERALVRPHIVSGTHAIALGLYGVLRHGDELLAVTGGPYDTLEEVIGIRGRQPGSLADLGITYRQVDLLADGKPDLNAIRDSLSLRTKMVLIQKSRGYSLRPSLTVEDIGKIIDIVRRTRKDIVCFVDNCYGEFVETHEPTEVGADLIAGSLIKNPGGGLAPSGGYLAGKAELVEKAANRLTAPGIGAAVGASLVDNRLLYQGLFLAPHTVAEAVKGMIYAAGLFAALGFDVAPRADERRCDIIQSIRLGTAERMVAFCRGLQQYSPVDSHVAPEPSPMPGYADKVVMAGGTFVQGATSELSADGPLREPFVVYIQGGLAYGYIKLAILGAAKAVMGI